MNVKSWNHRLIIRPITVWAIIPALHDTIWKEAPEETEWAMPWGDCVFWVRQRLRDIVLSTLETTTWLQFESEHFIQLFFTAKDKLWHFSIHKAAFKARLYLFTFRVVWTHSLSNIYTVTSQPIRQNALLENLTRPYPSKSRSGAHPRVAGEWRTQIWIMLIVHHALIRSFWLHVSSIHLSQEAGMSFPPNRLQNKKIRQHYSSWTTQK